MLPQALDSSVRTYRTRRTAEARSAPNGVSGSAWLPPPRHPTPLHLSELPEARPRPAPVVLPPADDSSGGEYCLVDEGGSWQPVRLAEHSFFWERPDVYEYLVRDLLEGQATETICRMLAREVEAAGSRIDRLRLLDFGAGNGWVGSELAGLGAQWIFGIDRSPAAACAAARDNPGVYEDYLVMDMRRLSEAQRDRLMHFDFNGLASVEPLGADEPPPNPSPRRSTSLRPAAGLRSTSTRRPSSARESRNSRPSYARWWRAVPSPCRLESGTGTGSRRGGIRWCTSPSSVANSATSSPDLPVGPGARAVPHLPPTLADGSLAAPHARRLRAGPLDCSPSS